MNTYNNFKIKACKIIISVCFIGIAIIGICLLFDAIFGDKKPILQPVAQTKTEQQFNKHDGWIEDQFSKMDGRHIKLVQFVKPKLNDPKSFEHVETHYNRQGDDIIVFMTYRAKNEYGAIMMGVIKAKVCYSNDAIEIL